MWRIALRAGVSIALMWLLLREQDLAGLLRQMALVNVGALLLATALFAILIVPLALRWSVILDTLGTPRGFRATFPPVMIGLFFGQALPASIGGDIMRMWLARNIGLPLSVAISSVVVDRLSGLLPLLMLVTAGLPGLFYLPLGKGVASGVVLIVAAGYFGFAVALSGHLVPARLERIKLVRGLRQFSLDLRATLLSSRAAIPVLGYGLLNQIGNALVIFVLAKGIGLSVTVATCLLIVPLANLLQTLPISIAGWGVREAFFVLAFGWFGTAPEKALTISVLFGLLGIVVSLPGGVMWLVQKRSDGRANSSISKDQSINSEWEAP